MLTTSELATSIEAEAVPRELSEDLVDLHLEIQTAFFRKDYEKCLLKSGKFVETVFQVLENFLSGDYSLQPKFGAIEERLRSDGNTGLPDALRLAVPRVCSSIYTLRSKRGAHKGEVEPGYQDATYAVQATSWVLSEIIRLYGSGPAEELDELVNQVVTQDLPFVEEFDDGDVVILLDGLSCREEALLVLYHFYPQRITPARMKAYLSHQTPSNVSSSLSNAVKERLVHRSDVGYTLTLRGRKTVERDYGPRLGEM